MQFFARRLECKHIVWAGPLVTTAATLNVADELRGRSCPTCGEIVRKVDFVAIEKPLSTFDESPAPRNAENKLKKTSNADVEKTRQRLAGLGAEVGGLAADLKKSALGLAPPQWRDTLANIPVGILRTYEPNAECIRFEDSAMPAIVFHQGLAGYLFKMNRSIFPLLRMGSLGGGAIRRFVEDGKARSALRVQAVDTALEFLGVGRPRSKALVEIPMIARLLEMPLTRTMSAFVLCHEYGHAVLNHADELRSVGRDAKFSLLERSRAMEFEADTWGQDALIGAFTGGKNLEPSLAMLDDLFSGDAFVVKQDISHAAPCAALLYFEFLDVIEEWLVRRGVDVAGQDAFTRRRARMAEKTASGQSTHPSNQDRFQALYAHLSEHGNFTAHTWVEAFEMLLDEIKDDLDDLIDKTGAVPRKRLTRRLQPRSRAKRGPGSWRDTITHIDDDDATRIRLQEALRNVEGQVLRLDEAELRRHFEAQKDRAEAHYRKQEYAEAEQIYTRILDSGETTESVPLYPLLGECRERLGDRQGAIAAYRRCLEIVPGSDFAALCGFSLGRILLFDEKDPAGAETALTAATTSHVLDIRAQAMFWLGTIAHGRREVEAALRRYQDVYALRESEFTLFPRLIPLAALNIGGVLEERGRFAEAAKMFEYARDHPAIDPKNRALAEQHLRAVRGR
ncbi:tetratricopeptide repeat protein [Actinoallomurus sp. NBC_01490]|uniref:tetratricopeptide repeat protein n=1 Tax=Actinoallomurus sp. NBC_01490 TaxID=2903557 RepID=UPI002E32F87C|nr:tetratricopeptide repeat protein [Actinoallomurus sp. NBC_01490]